MHMISLNGDWRLRAASETETFPAAVPGNVHQALLAAGRISDPYFVEHELDVQWISREEWIYSREIDLDAEMLSADHLELVCAGLDTLARVVWNGEEIATADNMFREWAFDLKACAKVGRNTLTIHFDSPLPLMAERQAARPLSGVRNIAHEPEGRSYVRKEGCNFGWDWGPVLITCGIWRDISIRAWNRRRLVSFQSVQHPRANGGVELEVRAELTGRPASGDRLRVTLSRDGVTVVETETNDLKGGTLRVPQPERWWPNGFGAQPLYDLEVSLISADATAQSLRHRIGFRTLELVREADAHGESFYFRVNGIPIFAKGSNWIPADTLHRTTPAQYRDLLQSAADSHQNMLRVWGGGFYEEEVFYDLCDELGLLVWQDFMFSCAAYPADDPAFRANVENEVRDQARRLGDRACLALWCGNNELEQGAAAMDDKSWPRMPREVYEDMFDRWIPAALHAVRPEALYWPSSPHTPGENRADHSNPDRGDAHLWAVWHGSKPFEWYRTAFHRFCSEFGFQSYPELRTVEGFTRPEDRNVTSAVMEFHQRSGIGNTKIIQYMLEWFRMPDGFANTLRLSQIQQGLAIQYAVEHWRIHRPRCMGALYWQLNDCWPVASWASIDYHGRWKSLHYFAKRFFAPFLITGVEDAQTRRVRVHAANDTADAAEVSAAWTVTDAAGRELGQGEFRSELPGCAAALLGEVDCSLWWESHGPRNLLVWLELWRDGELLSENPARFVKPKHLEIVPAKIEAALRPVAEGEWEVIVSADHAALWVHLELADCDFRASDNDFCLRPGLPRTLRLRPAVPLLESELRAQLRISSLRDTTA